LAEWQSIKPMRMFRHFPKPRDIPAILIAFVLVAVSLYVHFKYPAWRSPSGFGPEWQCSEAGRDGPDFCMKKPAADPANQTTVPN
jgi:hypothetical protein